MNTKNIYSQLAQKQRLLSAFTIFGVLVNYIFYRQLTAPGTKAKPKSLMKEVLFAALAAIGLGICMLFVFLFSGVYL